jgi:hypothetical protein
LDSTTTPQALKSDWAPDPDTPKSSIGDLLAVPEGAGGTKLRLHQITGYIPDDVDNFMAVIAGHTGYQLKYIDTRLGADSDAFPRGSDEAIAEALKCTVDELDWFPADETAGVSNDDGDADAIARLMSQTPVYLGHCEVIATAIPPTPMQRDASRPWSGAKAQWRAPVIGLDASSFFDEKSFLSIWRFEEEGPEAEEMAVENVFQCPNGHGPSNDLARIIEAEEIKQALQTRMGVPVEKLWYLSNLRGGWLLGDNEPSNRGRLAGFHQMLNRYAEQQWNWRVAQGLIESDNEDDLKWIPIEFQGCGLHVINLFDTNGSKYWRMQMDDHQGGLRVGGMDKKESWPHWVCRFFSRILRWNVGWRGFTAKEKADMAECARCLRSRFWTRLQVAEYMFDRFDWIWEYFTNVKTSESLKESAMYKLLAEIHQFKDGLHEDLLVMRCVHKWAHSPLAHACATIRGKTGDDGRDQEDRKRDYVKLVAKTYALAERAMTSTEEDDGCDDEAVADGEAARYVIWREHAAPAIVQRDDLQFNCVGKKQRRDAGVTSRNKDNEAEKQRAVDLDERLQAVRDAMKPGGDYEISDRQHKRLRLYAQAVVEMTAKYLQNILDAASDTDAIKLLASIQHAFDIERGNGVLKIIHDRNVNSSAELCMGFLIGRVHARRYAEVSPSGSRFSMQHPPPHWRQWQKDTLVPFSRNMSAQTTTQAELRSSQYDNKLADEAAAIKTKMKTYDKKVAKAKEAADANGGLVSVGKDCPEFMTVAAQDQLELLINAAFAHLLSKPDDQQVLTSSRWVDYVRSGKCEHCDPSDPLLCNAKMTPALEDDTCAGHRLRVLLEAALGDCNEDWAEWLDQFAQDTEDDYEYTVAEIIGELNGYPTRCNLCRKGALCTGTRLDSRALPTSALFAGIKVDANGAGWTFPVIVLWLKKLNLCRHQRDQSYHQACVAAGIDLPEIDSPFPTTFKDKAAAVAVWVQILAAHDVVLPRFDVDVGLAKELELLQAELDRRLGAPEQAASTDGAMDLEDEATTGGGASR